MEIEDQVRTSPDVERRRGDPFARGAVLVAGVGTVHLRIVDRISVFGDLERVIVDDPDDQDRPGEFGGIEPGNDPTDDADAV